MLITYTSAYENDDTRLLHAFGNKDLVFPRSILSVDDKFIISDVGKHRVSIYDQNGSFVKSKGGKSKPL